MASKIKVDVYYVKPLSEEARVFFEDMTDSKGHSYDALMYCDSVQTGETIVCNLVRRAVCRQYRDIERDCRGDTIYYDPIAGDRIVDFVQLMPHVKGPLARTPLLLEPWQKFVLTTTFGWKMTETHQRRFRRIYIEVPRGNGKALALDTIIPTTLGMQSMDALQVGDQVFDEHGEICDVTAVTEVMHNRPCYRVIFSDGTEIVADENHEWLTNTTWGKPSVKTTKEIVRKVKYGLRQDNFHSVDVVSSPVQGLFQQLPIDPYTLGVWLGDGRNDSPRLTLGLQDAHAILIKVRHETGPLNIDKAKNSAVCTILNMRHVFMGLRLLKNKHIPQRFMMANVKQREALLQGLMDTDGFISKAGQCEIISKYKRLAYDIRALANSLGFRATVTEKEAKVYEKSYGTVYRVTFHAYSDSNVKVATLDRKLARLKPKPASRSLQNTRTIVSVEACESVPVKCIEVNSPNHLYLCTESYIPTHNSALSSPVGLYGMTSDGEMGAEVYSAATSRDQAKIVFDVAKMMANMADEFKSQVGVGTFAHHMEQASTGSFFRPLSTEGNHLDGLNIHIGIIDELHAHKTREVYDVLVTGIGKRLQSMIWMITTAGFDTGGVCYEERTYMASVLMGEVQDDSVFGIMYTLDEWDDWTQPEAWQKANPCWGTAVRPEIVEQLAKKAMTIPSFQNNFRTKHLNEWMNADSVWMDMAKWDQASMPHVKMDQMQGLFTECFVGIDLASKKDLAAVSYLFTLDDEACEILKVPFNMKYMLFTQFYLPQEAAEQGENSQYLGWVHDGYIKATPGNVTDFATIEDDVIRNCKKFEIEEVAFDPWQSTQMAQNMQKHGLEPIEYRNTVATMSEPMKAFDALIISDKMVHEGNPCMRWNVSNTVCHFDAKDNIFPRKTRVENKIDGVVATIMALGRATLHDEDNGSAYDDEWDERE